jgi:hypothetical protein
MTEPVVNSDNPSDNSTTKNARIVETTTEEPRSTTKKNISDIKEDFRPVVGYAEEPLLTNILHNLSFYV